MAGIRQTKGQRDSLNRDSLNTYRTDEETASNTATLTASIYSTATLTPLILTTFLFSFISVGSDDGGGDDEEGANSDAAMMRAPLLLSMRML